METDEAAIPGKQLSVKPQKDWVWRKAKIKDITLILRANLVSLCYPKYKLALYLLLLIALTIVFALNLFLFSPPLLYKCGLLSGALIIDLGVLLVTFVIVAISVFCNVRNGHYRIYCQESGQGDSQKRPSSVFLEGRVIITVMRDQKKTKRLEKRAERLEKKAEKLKDVEKFKEAQELQTESDLIRDGIGHIWNVDDLCAMPHGEGLGPKVLTQVICFDIEPESNYIVLAFHANYFAYKMYEDKLKTSWGRLLDGEHSDQLNRQSYQIVRLGWKYNPLCLYAVVFDRSPLKAERDKLSSCENSDIPIRKW